MLAAVLLFTGAARAQTFTDLDFEQATIVSTNALPPDGESIAPFGVVASDALPGWTVEYGTTPISTIWGAPEALDETVVQMVGEEYNFQTRNFVLNPGAAIDGNFSVNLYATQYSGESQSTATASISQLGQIPLGAKSIEFLISGSSSSVNGFGAEAQPTVTFDGNIISVVPLSENNGITTMIGDVSEYAGMEGELTFSAIPSNAPNLDLENQYTLDDISFSTQAAPEPSSWALASLATASVALIRYRWNRA